MIYTNPQGEKFNALKDINVEILEGDYVAILGTSGSGKTTLSNVIGMLNGKYQGEYYFDGVAMHALKESTLFKLRGEKFGFIFQDYVLLDYLTAVENVALALQYHNLSKKKIYEMATAKLISVGLGDKLHHKPFQLSGGQKQRVSIARALIKDPKVIIADEPTGALDHNSRVEVLSLLQELNQQGVTIITVTHSNEDAQAAKRIIQVEKGEIKADRLQRYRSRYFGKLVNYENPAEIKIRKEMVLDYINLNYGIESEEAFLNFAHAEDFDQEIQFKILNQLKPQWISHPEINKCLHEWYDQSEELIQFMIAGAVLRAKNENLDVSNFDEKLKIFFATPWSEETCMIFFQNLKAMPFKELAPRLKLEFFFKHESNKVRATATQFFKHVELINLESRENFIQIALKDTDHRVRSNTLDYIYTLKDYDFSTLKNFGFEQDKSGRVKAIWAEMLIALGEREVALSILTPMIFSQESGDILAAVWVLAKDKNFHIVQFLNEKLEQNPKLLSHIDEILKTYGRVKKDLMNWRQVEAVIENKEPLKEAA